MSACGWPFHSQPGCPDCAYYELLYSDGVDQWLQQKAEIREAAKRERMERKIQGERG